MLKRGSEGEKGDQTGGVKIYMARSGVENLLMLALFCFFNKCLVVNL